MIWRDLYEQERQERQEREEADAHARALEHELIAIANAGDRSGRFASVGSSA